MRKLLQFLKTRRLLRHVKTMWKKEDTLEMTRFMATPTGYKIRCIIDDFVVNSAFNAHSNEAYRMGAVDLRTTLLSLVDETTLMTQEESDGGNELEQ